MDQPFSILTKKDFTPQSEGGSAQAISSFVANPSSTVRRFHLPDEGDVEVVGEFLKWIDTVRSPENTQDTIESFIQRCKALLQSPPPRMRGRDEDLVSKAPSYPSNFFTEYVCTVVDIEAPSARQADLNLRSFLPGSLALSTIAAKRTAGTETFQFSVDSEEHVGNRIYAAGLFREKSLTKQDQTAVKDRLRRAERVDDLAYEPLRPGNFLSRLYPLTASAIEQALPGAIQSFSPYFVQLYPSQESTKTKPLSEQSSLMKLHDEAQKETVVMMERSTEGNRYPACAEFQTEAVKYLKKWGADLGEPVEDPSLVKLRGKGSGCRADEKSCAVRGLAIPYFRGTREILVSGQSLSWPSCQALVFGRNLELPDDHYMFVHFQRFQKRGK